MLTIIKQLRHDPEHFSRMFSKWVMGPLEDGYDDPPMVDQVKPPRSYPYRRPKWSNIILLIIMHLGCIGFYIYISLYDLYFPTLLWAFALGMLSGIGTSSGAHRLWSHRAYKAKSPVKIFLLIFQAISMNGSAYTYARDHRTHHQFSDTEGDPKNPTRGLFYAHVGWWLLEKSDSVKQAGSKLDYSDLRNDYWVWFQHQHYRTIFLICGVLIPWLVPVVFWNEDPWMSFGICVLLRITVVLHHLFTVNSLAHFFGYRPYDFRIRPADHRIVNYISFGEGIHNFHHVFPYDYRINERPQWELFNPGTAFIRMCHLFGWVYDLKTASKAVIEGTVKRRGIVAQRDPPRGLLFRIANAVFDWNMGLLFDIWIVYPGLFFKIFTERNTVIWP